MQTPRFIAQWLDIWVQKNLCGCLDKLYELSPQRLRKEARLACTHLKSLLCLKTIQKLNTHGPDVAGLGKRGGDAGVTEEPVGSWGIVGAADGESGEGTSTCFQSCPSSTRRAMRVPRGTLRLPSSIYKNTNIKHDKQKKHFHQSLNSSHFKMGHRLLSEFCSNSHEYTFNYFTMCFPKLLQSKLGLSL